MSEILDRYRQLAAAFAEKIAGVPPGSWNDPTPCTEWNVRELVAHVVEMSAVHLRIVGRPVPPGPSVDDDPLGAFKAVSNQIEEDLADPVRAEARFENRFFQCTFAEAIDRALCLDLAVHGWDLARATGQDERIDPAVLPSVWAAVKQFGDDVLRNPMVFASAVDLPEGADDQTRLLAHLGRQV
jgi:uncharacterized protein (TIGR03086 family)